MEQENNRDNILNIALKLFSKKGFDAVGVQLICEKAGITKPTLYYYFGNKTGLLNEVLNTNYAKLNEYLKTIVVYNPNPEEYSKDVYPLLLNVFNGYVDFAKNNMDFYTMVLSALCAPPSSELSKMVRDCNNTQYKIVEQMFKEISKYHGNMRKHEKRLAWTFIGMINSYIMLNSNSKIYEWVHQFMHGIF